MCNKVVCLPLHFWFGFQFPEVLQTHTWISVLSSAHTLAGLFPEQRLPCVMNVVVNFTSNLVMVQNEIAIVSLDNICYLPHLGRRASIPVV
jgi:hypothetical protein